ncbi:MAG: GTP 3',8-cyclase MoaA [Chloroflexi bacterium]|nr:GTP 3',8-cyclase MoaA [Chloroflexota bacterium]MCH7655726.1 GTP 3',8-cyclase MoaA [Chloroflexota bacterium]
MSQAASRSETLGGVLSDTLGRPLHDLRISVTDRCNFRCTYCMPAELFGERYHFLPRAELLTYEEIARLAAIFVGFGVSKVRVTGGEPLVRKDVDTLVGMLHRTAGVEDLTLTTNGVLLPEQADRLKAAGLDRVTVSLDSLDPEVFGKMNGKGVGPDAVLAGIDAAERAGLRPIKVNTVVERGVNDHTVVDIARHFKGTGHIVRFIEYMDVGNVNGWKRERVVPSAELASAIDAVFPIEPLEPSYRGEVAERWRYRDGDGEIGFISSVTQPFCGDCTRVRLSPEGSVYTCLFASAGHDLRAPLRAGATDAELRERVAKIWRVRDDRYSEQRSALDAAGDARHKIEMFQIGG